MYPPCINTPLLFMSLISSQQQYYFHNLHKKHIPFNLEQTIVMAGLNSFSVVVVAAMLLAFVVAVEQDFNSLRICWTKLSLDCGEEIFMNIFGHSSKPVSDNCCHSLARIGLTCYNMLFDNIVNTQPGYKSNVTIPRPRSVQIWNKCSLVAGPVPPAT